MFTIRPSMAQMSASLNKQAGQAKMFFSFENKAKFGFKLSSGLNGINSGIISLILILLPCF
jgi:hypothetical protein